VPAVVHFISAEPLLGPLSMLSFLELLDPNEQWWVIVGGESGKGWRPMELDWARTLRDECWEHDVHFFFKQLGGNPNPQAHERAVLDGRRHTEIPAVLP
jgi:protein gp37